MDKTSLDLTGSFRGCSGYQLKLLFSQLIYVSFSSLVAVVFIAYILWPVANHQSLQIWAALVLIVILLRIALVTFLRKKNPADADLKPWRMATFALIFVAGVVWGSLAFIYDFNWPPMQQFAIFAVLVVIALGAITSYATILYAYGIYLVALFGPLSLLFIFSGIENYQYYGVGLILLGIVLFFLAKRYHDSVVKELGKSLHYRKSYYTLKSSHDDLSQELELKDSEEKAASAIFSQIAQLKPVDKEGIKGMVEPMGHFSGDSIYSALTPDEQCYVLFADFSGHGLPAALGSLPVSTIFHDMTADGHLPEAILKKINETLCTGLSAMQFCCACFISLNPQRTTAQIWNLGIPDVLIIKDQGESILRVPSTHIPLGIESSNRYQCEKINLTKGNLIFTYSDGVTETRSLENEFFGKERLEKYLLMHHQDTDLLEIIKSKMDLHLGELLQEDDVSMLEIRC